MSLCNESSHSIKHSVLYSVIDFIVEIKLITIPVIKPAKIFAKTDDRNGLLVMHTTEIVHATIERTTTVPNIQKCGKLAYILRFIHICLNLYFI